MTFEINTGGVYTFSASQIDQRMFGRDVGYKYSKVRMILLELLDSNKGCEPENIRYMHGLSKSGLRDAYIEALL
jgi:hypothetical protein